MATSAPPLSATVNAQQAILNQAGVDYQNGSGTIQSLITKMPVEVQGAVMNALVTMQQKVATPMQTAAGVLQGLAQQTASFEAKVAALVAKEAQLAAQAAGIEIEKKSIIEQWAALESQAVWNAH